MDIVSIEFKGVANGNFMTVVSERIRKIRKLFFRWVRSYYGGILPGVSRSWRST